MKIEKRFIKCLIFIFTLTVLFICIYGVPLNGAKATVKGPGKEVPGTFTGTWSPVKGKTGTFTAEDGWVFEGTINPDGGLWKGTLTNYPIPPEWTEKNFDSLPDFYTGAVDENVMIDLPPK